MIDCQKIAIKNIDNSFLAGFLVCNLLNYDFCRVQGPLNNH